MSKIGSKIKERREALGLSQDELAEMMGYKSRSTIAKIEKNVNDVTQTNIVKFAKILHTTPAYLMGWDTTEKTNTATNSDISNKIDLKTINQLNDTNISKVNSYAKNLLNIQKMEEEPILMAAHNDYTNEPDEQEKMLKDIEQLGKIAKRKD
nr:MAG TPA: helix-turn-helix domain protein [Caudoviricetes sp.]